MSEDKQKFVSLGGLWVKSPKSGGAKFLVGNFGFDGKILIFKNENKKGETSPDYFMYIAPQEDKPKPHEGENEPPF